MRFTLTRTIILLVAVSAGLAFFAPSAFAALTAKANHDNVQMSLGYHGSTVSVSGISDPNVDLILTLTASSGNAQEKLMRKDKEVGFLWMNVEQLTLDNVPPVYFVRSTKPLDQLLDPATLKTENLGYAAVESNISLSPKQTPDKQQSLLLDFIKYKESLNVYSQSVGDVDMKPDPSGGSSYYTVFDWPFQAPPGDYSATVYAVKDGRIIDRAVSPVTVEETGVVKTLDDMSQTNAALYGTAAIGVALTAGFGVGLVFKGGGSH